MGVIIRPTTSADREAWLRIMGGTPSQEQIGILGDERRARILREYLNAFFWKTMDYSTGRLLIDDGDPVGLIQLGPEPDLKVTPGLVWFVLRLYGPFGVRPLLTRSKAAQRVRGTAPPDALHIAEVHVREDLRGKGYGEQLLRHAEETGIAEKAPRLSLTTTMANPARRLYLRFGFTVTAEMRDAEYERYTGIPGRILMEKPLPSAT